ncbi:MAG: hypothetical protein IKC69_00615 [Clostridia bacterium]|nr:hypothetical protein [Clostridia bacterium]
MLCGFSQIRFDDAFDYRIGGTFTNYLKSETEFHTPLYATAWAVKSGEDSFIWVSLDVARVVETDADTVRNMISQETGVPFDHILISATHNHTGPTARASISPYFPTGDLSYFDKLWDVACRAGVAAWNDTEQVTYSYATCEEKACTHNRRYLMDTGISRMHPGGKGFPGRLMKEGPEDPQLQAIWFQKEGEIRGILVHYSAHPSLLYGLKVTSSDYPGVLRRTLQQVYGENVPVMFLQGCAGNLTPRDHENDADWAKGIRGTERIGKALAGDVIRMISLTREEEDTDRIRLLSSKVRIDLREVTEEDRKKSDEIFALLEQDRDAFFALNVSKKAYANKVRNLMDKWKLGAYEEVPVHAIQIGNITFVTNPAELFCEYQLDLKERMGPRTLCVELTNGGICYVATKQGYLLKGYEVDAGFYDYFAGERIEEAMIDLGQKVREL